MAIIEYPGNINELSSRAKACIHMLSFKAQYDQQVDFQMVDNNFAKNFMDGFYGIVSAASLSKFDDNNVQAAGIKMQILVILKNAIASSVGTDAACRAMDEMISFFVTGDYSEYGGDSGILGGNMAVSLRTLLLFTFSDYVNGVIEELDGFYFSGEGYSYGQSGILGSDYFLSIT